MRGIGYDSGTMESCRSGSGNSPILLVDVHTDTDIFILNILNLNIIQIVDILY